MPYVMLLAKTVAVDIRRTAVWSRPRRSLLDTACARVALGQSSTPAAIEDSRREIEHLDVELGILEREKAVGHEHGERLAELTGKKEKGQTRLATLEKRWTEEKKLVEEIMKVMTTLEQHALAASGKG